MTIPLQQQHVLVYAVWQQLGISYTQEAEEAVFLDLNVVDVAHLQLSICDIAI